MKSATLGPCYFHACWFYFLYFQLNRLILTIGQIIPSFKSLLAFLIPYVSSYFSNVDMVDACNADELVWFLGGGRSNAICVTLRLFIYTSISVHGHTVHGYAMKL